MSAYVKYFRLGCYSYQIGSGQRIHEWGHSDPIMKMSDIIPLVSARTPSRSTESKKRGHRVPLRFSENPLSAIIHRITDKLFKRTELRDCIDSSPWASRTAVNWGSPPNVRKPTNISESPKRTPTEDRNTSIRSKNQSLTALNAV